MNKKKVALSLAIMGTLLGSSAIATATTTNITALPYPAVPAAGGTYNVSNLTDNNAGNGAIELTAGTTEGVSLVISNSSIKNTSSIQTGAGIIHVVADAGNVNLGVNIDSNSIISTTGNNSDAVHLIGIKAKLGNYGTIMVDTPATHSAFGLVVANSAIATNHGTIESKATPSTSPAVFTGYLSGTTLAYSDLDVSTWSFTNETDGKIKASNGSTGILMSHNGYGYTIANKGDITITDSGAGIASFEGTGQTNAKNLVVRNAGKITTEKGDGIRMKNMYAKSTVQLLDNCEIKTTGNGASNLDGAPVGVRVSNTDLNFHSGNVKITTEGDYAAAIDARDKSHIIFLPNNKTVITTSGRGGGSDNSASGINLIGTDSMMHTFNTADVTITTSGHTADGIYVGYHAQLYSDGKISFSTAGGGAEAIEIVNASGSFGTDSITNIETLASNGYRSTNSYFVIQGQWDSNAGDNDMQLYSGSRLYLTTYSNVYLHGKANGIVVDNSELEQVGDGVLKIDVTTDAHRGISVENNGKAKLSGTVNVDASGINSDGLVATDGGNINILSGGNVDVKAHGNMGDAFGVWGSGANQASIIINQGSTVNATVDGTDGQGVYVRGSHGYFRADNNTLNIVTNGNNSSGILADTGATAVMEGGSITTNGTASSIAMAADPNSIVDLKNTVTTTNGNAGAFRVENEGLVRLNGITNTSATEAMVTNTKGTINATNSNLVGNIKHYGLDSYSIGATSNGTVPAVIGDLNVNMVNSNLTGLTDVNLAAANARLLLDIDGNSLWNMTGNSFVNRLTTTAGSTVDMTQDNHNDSALTIDNFVGTGGDFIFDTDLQTQTDGDKMIINAAAAGDGGNVQVYDRSLVRGQQVTGIKKLLLITDNSAATTWAPKTLDTGGLWQITPTLEKLADNNWYLTMAGAEINPSTNDTIGTFESGYGLWRGTVLVDDTLRQRLGDLRYDDSEDGVWARIKTGRLAADKYSGSYQRYQVGYDKKSGHNIYGLAVDHTRNSNTYDQGDGDNSMNNLSLYATNYRTDGTYSDIVLRAGKLLGDMDTKGQVEDSLDYNTWAYSISYELGKTMENSKGYFFEPQAQIVLGRLQGGDYTTNRGVKIERDSINSLIGRLGFVAGRKISKTSDYYIKGNILREFSGDEEMGLNYQDQLMNYSNANKDTWFELGVGGNAKLANKTHVYGDIVKTFGADIQKKWQVNAGVRWEF